MVARTVLDNFRVVGDNSDDIRAVFQVVVRLSQDVGECEDLHGSDNCGQFNYRPEPISKFDHVSQSIKGDSSESSPITESVGIVDKSSKLLLLSTNHPNHSVRLKSKIGEVGLQFCLLRNEIR